MHRLPDNQPHPAHTRRSNIRLTFCTNTSHTPSRSARTTTHRIPHSYTEDDNTHSMCMPHRQTTYHLVSVSIHTRETCGVNVHRLPDNQPHPAHTGRSNIRLTACTNTTHAPSRSARTTAHGTPHSYTQKTTQHVHATQTDNAPTRVSRYSHQRGTLC